MKERIAVLGGGAAALTAVYQLTNLPDWSDRYDITVYQMGWRLGGKGASGRDEGRHMRNEEHGLHVMFGCYENVFRMLGRVYEEVKWKPGETPWSIHDAFEPHDLISMFEHHDGRWKRWDFDAVRADGFPGVGEPLELGPGNYLRLLIRWARGQIAQLIGGESALEHVSGLERAESHDREVLRELQEVESLTEELAGEASRLRGEPATPQLLESVLGDFVWRRIVGLAERSLDWLRGFVPQNDAMRRLAINAEFALIVAIGLLRDGVIHPRENWFAIDHYDLRDWLRHHGASDLVLDSAPTQGLYDAVFSWNAPIGAGTILHALARASHYKGAIVYKMQAGMGDTIFAPLLRVLEARGVRFRFFHAVQELVLSRDTTRIEAVVMDEQARIRGGGRYEPLIDVGGRPCWPNRPLLEQLEPEDAAALAGHDPENWWDGYRGREKTLRAGEDFDRVLLGISVGAFPYVARDLVEDPNNPAFAEMVRALVTTQTQCSQLWMERSLEQLGWSGEAPITIPYDEPFDTWADMSHLLAVERFPSSVQSCAYLCSSIDDDEPLPPRSDHTYPERQHARVRANAHHWLERSAGTLWPAVATSGTSGFDWDVLFDPEGRTGPGRLDAQFHIATRNPSDRYVRIVPGSSERRLAAGESGYANLVMAGDWLRTGMSLGCLESAVEGGIQAARAIDPRVPRAVFDWIGDAAESGAPESVALATAKSRASKPYVTRDGEMLTVPPVGLRVDMNTFVLAAEQRSLERLVDRELNLGGPRRYWPAGPFVVAYCSNLLNITPAGTIGELDFGFWVPVFSGHVEGMPERLLTYTPYLWVDNSPAVVGGRSVFGYPKHQGRLLCPKDEGDEALFRVVTWVTRIQGQAAEDLPLLEIRRRDEVGWGKTREPWSLGSATRAIRTMLQTQDSPAPPVLDLLQTLLRGALPNVFLKEIPEIDGTWHAAYRAIAENEIDMTTEPAGGPLAGDWEVRLLQAFSHQIATRLGLSNQRRVQSDHVYCAVPALLCTWMSFEARVQPGRVV